MVTKPSSVERAGPRGAPGVAWRAGMRRYGVPVTHELARRGPTRSAARGRARVADPDGATALAAGCARRSTSSAPTRPAGSRCKVGVAVAGALVVAVGIVLIPLPGPGWLHRHRRPRASGRWSSTGPGACSRFTRSHVHALDAVGDAAVAGRTRCVLGAVGLVFVSTVVWLSLKYSFGIDLLAEALDYVRDALTPEVRGSGAGSGTVVRAEGD